MFQVSCISSSKQERAAFTRTVRLTLLLVAPAGWAQLTTDAQLRIQAGNADGIVSVDVVPDVGVHYQRRQFEFQTASQTAFGTGYASLWSHQWQSQNQASWYSPSQRLRLNLNYDHSEQRAASDLIVSNDVLGMNLRVMVPQSALLQHQLDLDLAQQQVSATDAERLSEGFWRLGYQLRLAPTESQSLASGWQYQHYRSGTAVASSQLNWQWQSAPYQFLTEGRLNYSTRDSARVTTLGGTLQWLYTQPRHQLRASIRRSQEDAVSYFSLDVLDTSLRQSTQLLSHSVELSADRVTLTPWAALNAYFRLSDSSQLAQLSLVDISDQSDISDRQLGVGMTLQLSQNRQLVTSASHRSGDLPDLTVLGLSYRQQWNSRYSLTADIRQRLAEVSAFIWTVGLDYRL